jgi:predicted RNA-binding protein Jag
LSGARSIELSPQRSNIRREQHELVRKAKLLSHSLGREPNRRLRIYRDSGAGGKS